MKLAEASENPPAPAVDMCRPPKLSTPLARQLAERAAFYKSELRDIAEDDPQWEGDSARFKMAHNNILKALYALEKNPNLTRVELEAEFGPFDWQAVAIA